MTGQDIKKRITIIPDDFEFLYKGILGSVCPFARNDISVTYDGVTNDFTDVDTALDAKLFDGKSLNEIADAIEW
jgi:hypothetical protein